jgi:hypothetical protein
MQRHVYQIIRQQGAPMRPKDQRRPQHEAGKEGRGKSMKRGASQGSRGSPSGFEVVRKLVRQFAFPDTTQRSLQIVLDPDKLNTH